METAQLRKSGSEGSEKDISSGSGSGAGAVGGWVYHLGVNSIGREYCHLRYLFIRGKYVEMYKRDPNEIPGIVRETHFSLSLFSIGVLSLSFMLLASVFGILRCLFDC